MSEKDWIFCWRFGLGLRSEHSQAKRKLSAMQRNVWCCSCSWAVECTGGQRPHWTSALENKCGGVPTRWRESNTCKLVTGGYEVTLPTWDWGEINEFSWLFVRARMCVCISVYTPLLLPCTTSESFILNNFWKKKTTRKRKHFPQPSNNSVPFREVTLAVYKCSFNFHFPCVQSSFLVANQTLR